MKIHIEIPRATADDWRWRQYKGFALVYSDCVDCEVVKGKVVAQSRFGDWKHATAASGGLQAVIGKRVTVAEARVA